MDDHDTPATRTFGYAGAFTVLAWQAERGQSVLHPDAPSLVAFGAVAALTLVGVDTVVTSARRQIVELAAVHG
ncbi:hypothetical protein ABT369_47175 [Dactylosporangium sp. NPDC000244]|uniref:hypothetical protein n=1 Tax=Dactylosporangium sp. NPDC000244 TaxID=3154365 RepID=UPI00332681CC